MNERPGLAEAEWPGLVESGNWGIGIKRAIK